MDVFKRYLSLWVGLCISFGVLLGNWQPDLFRMLARMEWAQVNLVVAVLIWLMIYPMMVQIDFTALGNARKQPLGLALTLIINWIIKPFTMAAIAWLFFRVLYVPWVNPQTATEYMAGMILLGVAPCTAMVFVWSQLTQGDPNYTLMQVAVNDVIMVFAFAPIAALLLGVSNISVPWETLLFSVVLYVLIPLIIGFGTRKVLTHRYGSAQVDTFLATIKPLSILGLLATVILLFGLQAQTIIDHPLIIGLIAIPLVLQTLGIFLIAYVAARYLKLPFNIAAPACLIGTSNFFELAVAVAISLFGLGSGAALATVVGVLVEVPIMLFLVMILNRTKMRFQT